jgi:Tfp pilus assembly protein PilO
MSLKIQQKEKELKDLEDYISHLKKISLQLQEFAPQLTKIDQALLKDSYLPNFFDFSQKLAAESALGLDQVIIGPTTPFKGKENIKAREVNIKLSGQYPNFKNFLINLEKNARLIEVKKLYFSSKSLKEVPKYDLTIQVYSY